MNHTLETKDYDGIGANQSTNGLERYLELTLSNFENRVYEYEPGKAFAADDEFIAKQMQPTCSGKKVDLSYRLTVQAQYGSICADLPHCTIPLVITPPPLPSFGTVQPPAGWAPQIMPIVQIDQSVNLMNAAMNMAAGAANAAAGMTTAMGGVGMNVQVAAPQVQVPAPQV